MKPHWFIDSDGCWVWQGALTKGLPVRGVKVGSRFVTQYVARIEYVAACGPIPPGHQLRRACRNALCVRPDHGRLHNPKGPLCLNGHQRTPGVTCPQCLDAASQRHRDTAKQRPRICKGCDRRKTIMALGLCNYCYRLERVARRSEVQL